MADDDQNLNLDRLRRLSEFWNWLPAYRAVAETEHVRTAARRLRVSPSALSRSIGLLEDSLGEQLFDREGRGIRLNRAGHEFLSNLRVAMRLIDEGLRAVESASFLGTLHVAAPDDLLPLLWPALNELQSLHPGLILKMHSVASSEVNNRLARGALDIAFMQDPEPESGLVVEHFAETTNGVYCGADHALFGREDVDVPDVLDHGFVAGESVDGLPSDAWPPDVDRNVRLYVSRLQAAVEAAAFGGMLASLPDHVAEPYRERELLWRIPVDLVPGTAFYMMRRVPVMEADRNSIIATFLHENVDGERAES